MMPITLSRSEISALTERATRPAQMRQLEAMNIPYLVRADGSLAVLRHTLPGATQHRRNNASNSPNFAAIHEKTPR